MWSRSSSTIPRIFLKCRMMVAVCSLLIFLLGSRQKASTFFFMSSACPLMSGIGRVVPDTAQVSCFVSISSSSVLFLFFVSGLSFPQLLGSRVLSAYKTTLAFVMDGVCTRDYILSHLVFAPAHRSLVSLSPHYYRRRSALLVLPSPFDGKVYRPPCYRWRSTLQGLFSP